MRYRLVVFDLDGTLVDTVEVHAESWAYAFAELGLGKVSPGELVRLIGLPGDSIVREVLGEGALRYYDRIRWLKDRYFLRRVAEGSVRPYRDVPETLDYLRSRGYLIGLATSTPNYILIPLLEYLGVLEVFDVVVGGDEVLRGKPDPEIFLRAAAKASVEPRKTVVVGDTEYDSAAAKSAGMLSVLVDRGGRGNPSKTSADIVVGSLTDLSLLL
ncbi:MAG: HAD family hydrolase [Desulfurococcaceae archaeon]|nr:HAD family hydrolase [Desulfurococcaceae archaeon]